MAIFIHYMKNREQGLKSLMTPNVKAFFLYETAKKSPGQKTGFGNRGRLKALNDTKLVLNEHE